MLIKLPVIVLAQNISEGVTTLVNKVHMTTEAAFGFLC